MKSVPLSSLDQKRRSLSIVQFFFFSALGCLLPFLSCHMKEIGLTTFEIAFLNSLTAVGGVIAAPISGFVAHKLHKYQTFLVLTLIGSAIAYTGLLLVPRVIWTPRHPQIIFDCSSSHLRIESCKDWDGQCHIKPKQPAIGNFTNFSLTKCQYNCPSETSMNASWYPLQICFNSVSEGNMCLSHDPAQADRGAVPNGSGNSNNILQEYPLIQFDSRFDRWPVVSLKGDRECVFQTVSPLIVNHKSFDTIHCRPIVHNCQINCKVNLLHRPKSISSGNPLPRRPTPCLDVTGEPKTTFYVYLAVRTMADLLLFTAYNLMDGMAITLTNNFDTLYGGSKRTRSIVLPFLLVPTLSGFLVDYYSTQAGQPDYAPPFILFDGLMIITAILVVAAPATPLSQLGKSFAPSMSTTSLRSTASLRLLQQKTRISVYHWIILCGSVIPLTLWSGILWALMQTHLYPFYIDLGVSKLWLGISFSVMLATFLPFSLLGKKLVSGIGRLHLILLSLIFCCLRFSAISFLTDHPRLLLLPLEAMEALTYPLGWFGITSYAHFLIKTTLRPELMTRTGVDPSNANHMKMQYFLNGLHFGLGRVVGSALWMAWLYYWEKGSLSKALDWFNIEDSEFPENDSYGFRILLRLLAVTCASIALPLLFFYHVFGKILSCLGEVVRETKESLLCVKDIILRCFSLLCCCSCSCRMGKCRLCRRRWRPEDEYEEDVGSHHPSRITNETPSKDITEMKATSLEGVQYTRLMDNSLSDGRPSSSFKNGSAVHISPSIRNGHAIRNGGRITGMSR